MDWKNRLYFGDNLDILRREVPDASVDLIYLDPPFNSNATYNVLFKEKSGEESAAQIMAFEDTWQWGIESEAVYKEIVTSAARGNLTGVNTGGACVPGGVWLVVRSGMEGTLPTAEGENGC
jgi:16S rRNA G966 N2-methylase RsmD